MASTINNDLKTTTNIETILNDYKVAVTSREASLMGRKEVFMGKAKFGIFGDGKEVAQIAMAKAFRKGDWRSGYYRDQTFMFAIGELTLEAFFAQLYAHTDVNADPSSAGRMMNSHFGTRILDEQGAWLSQTDRYNSSSDISCTAGNIPRLIGLAFASKLYKKNKALHHLTDFSNKGNEVAFGTIGNASTSEGHFWEGMNAAGVMGIPLLMAVWDDGYGISVPNEYHTVKQSISDAMMGFQRKNKQENGFEIMAVDGWDYLGLVAAFQSAADICRAEHIPVLLHVKDLTQPQGHSTSGSHERYKSKERLDWEKEFDCIKKMREWMIYEGIATEAQLEEIRKDAASTVKKAKQKAYDAYLLSKEPAFKRINYFLSTLSEQSNFGKLIDEIKIELNREKFPNRFVGVKAIKKAMRIVRNERLPIRDEIRTWLKKYAADNYERYNAHLYNQSKDAATNVLVIPAVFGDNDEPVDGSQVLKACFDAAILRDPRIFAMGEDVGKIGDVNQGFAGLQKKHGDLRVMDTSIRETTIVGQAVGTALRGLRPLAEIQYLDYILYAIQVLSDDVATLRYRTKNGQKAPLIIRTRGHRLEGVWHSGSPMALLLGSIRGMHLLVPRNMQQASGMYNTLFQSGDPAILIEVLNAYRQKERIPLNIGEFTVPIGKVECLKAGTDFTIVTYGAMCRIVMNAAKDLEAVGISCEVIDVQSLLPFDIDHDIVKSIQQTSRVLFADEDVPGGASAYMLNEVLVKQNGWQFLDSKPLTLSAQPNRAAYGSDGDYFSKPNTEDVFEAVYQEMHEANPNKYPVI